MRGVTDAHTLIEHGANCTLATNNVLNAFTPYGDCSLTRIANLYANVVQRYGPQDLGVCFEMITARAARVMRLSDYGIAVGNAADLVVWMRPRPPTLLPRVRCRWRGLSAAGRSLRVYCPRSTGRTNVLGRGPRRPVSLQHPEAQRVSDQGGSGYFLCLRPCFRALGSRCAITGHFLHALPFR